MYVHVCTHVVRTCVYGMGCACIQNFQCSGLYPQLALADDSNSWKRDSEQVFHTKVCWHGNITNGIHECNSIHDCQMHNVIVCEGEGLVYNVRLCKCMYLMYDLCLIWHVLELTVYTEAQCLVCFVSVLCKLCTYTCLTWS